MVDTKQLIESLSSEVKPIKVIRPRHYGALLLVLLLIYAIITQFFLSGFRADIAMQMADSLFILELIILVSIFISASVASVYAMLPDACERKILMRLPYVFSISMLGLLVVQFFLQYEPQTALLKPAYHTHECTEYIVFVAILPAILIFSLLRKGASLIPMQAGVFVIMVAVSVGAITLRLAEDNNDIMHLIMWHYLPSIFLAITGTLLGRYLLRW